MFLPDTTARTLPRARYARAQPRFRRSVEVLVVTAMSAVRPRVRASGHSPIRVCSDVVAPPPGGQIASGHFEIDEQQPASQCLLAQTVSLRIAQFGASRSCGCAAQTAADHRAQPFDGCAAARRAPLSHPAIRGPAACGGSLVPAGKKFVRRGVSGSKSDGDKKTFVLSSSSRHREVSRRLLTCTSATFFLRPMFIGTACPA